MGMLECMYYVRSKDLPEDYVMLQQGPGEHAIHLGYRNFIGEV